MFALARPYIMIADIFAYHQLICSPCRRGGEKLDHFYDLFRPHRNVKSRRDLPRANLPSILRSDRFDPEICSEGNAKAVLPPQRTRPVVTSYNRANEYSRENNIEILTIKLQVVFRPRRYIKSLRDLQS